MNNKQATLAGLKALGYLEEFDRSKRYRCFRKSGRDVTLLVGKAGALRKTKGAIADSVSISETRVHKAFQEVGRRVESGALEANSHAALQLFVNICKGVQFVNSNDVGQTAATAESHQ